MTCLRSGFCCKQAPCSFGEETSPDNPSCIYLGGKEIGKYFCKKYKEIIDGMPDNMADLSPAFGHGCCSPLNSDRITLLGIKNYA